MTGSTETLSLPATISVLALNSATVMKGRAMKSILAVLAAIAVGHACNVQEECVVCPPRSGIFDRDEAVNAVPLAGKSKRNALTHVGRAVFMNGDSVVEVGDPPAAGGEG